VGSYSQPDWLIDRKRLSEIVPPRARARELWRVEEKFLQQAQDDATILAIRDQERAGIDIVTDGEMRRESYSNRFATELEGMDNDNPAQVPARTPGRFQIVPRVVGKLRRKHPVQVRDVEFLRANTDRQIKMTIPGPFTMTQQLFDEHYNDESALAMDCAAALNEEIKDLFAAGADIVQLDEPFLQAQPEKAREFGIEAIDRAIEGVNGTIRRICARYAASQEQARDIRSGRAGRSADRSIAPRSLTRLLDTAATEQDHSARVLDRRHERRSRRLPAHPPRPALCRARAYRRGAGLRVEISPARNRLREDEGDDRGSRHRARGIELAGQSEPFPSDQRGPDKRGKNVIRSGKTANTNSPATMIHTNGHDAR
jgi:hypothetical protein